MKKNLQEQIDYLKENLLSPLDYLTNKFQSFDIILLAENHGIKQNLDLVINSIPELYKSGVHFIGMEFGAREDQQALDNLITASSFDEELAKSLIFNYSVKWAYKEYWNIYRAAWKLNSTLEDDAPKFKILNLSYKYNWKDFSGIRTPESVKRIFFKGNTEIYRYNVIEEEIIKTNNKILVLTGTPHAFTRYKYPVYDAVSANFIYFQDGFLGNLLYHKYNNKVYTVLLHQIFQNKKTMSQDCSPANGNIEVLMNAFNNIPIGFDLINTPIGELEDDSYFSTGYDNFKLKDIFDGYIFINSFDKLEGCTIDYDFLTNHSFAEVKENFPDKDWGGIPETIEDYWTCVEQFVHKKI